MSARAGFVEAEAFLSTILSDVVVQDRPIVPYVMFRDRPVVTPAVVEQTPENTHFALSVDVKGQSRNKDNIADIKMADLIAPAMNPCGHAKGPNDALSSSGCMTCDTQDFLAFKESSRLRTDRRRRKAQSWLVNLAPRWEDAEIEHYRKKPGVKGQSWFPVSACGIVPFGDILTLDRRMDGRIDRLGIFRCGSVHTCPSCAQRIAQPRSRLVAAVIDAARAAGYLVAMWTLTMPHDCTTSLWRLVQRFHDAIDMFMGHGTVRNRMKEWDYLGHVNTYETTLALAEDLITNNGFHYHGHGIVVLGKSEDLAAKGLIPVSGDLSAVDDHNIMLMLKDTLWDIWSQSALNAGSPRAPSYRHGFDIRPVWNSTDYIMKLPELAVARDDDGNARMSDAKPAKPGAMAVAGKAAVPRQEAVDAKRIYKERWGAENEITKTFAKEGKKKSRTPFELLDDLFPGDRELFLDYARGSFGRSTIEWSRGRRDLCRIFIAPGYKRRSEVEDLYAEPEWVFSDEAKALPPEINLVVESADLGKDSCWRARKAGQNALEKAIARCQLDHSTLLDALENEGFAVEIVSQPMTINEPCYDKTTGELLFEERFIRADPEQGIFEDGVHLCAVTTPVLRPMKLKATYNLKARQTRVGKSPTPQADDVTV